MAFLHITFVGSSSSYTTLLFLNHYFISFVAETCTAYGRNIVIIREEGWCFGLRVAAFDYAITV